MVPSPDGNFLAVVTPYTIFIAVLPDSSHLSNNGDTTPLKLKTFQLGPTTHVIPESPVISAVWHPLGVHDNQRACIVTVTKDAAVRVWEIDRNDRWSFDQPTLAVDLRKLVDGTSLDQDFSPSGFGQNKGFSADSFDMEVASACFGGGGYDDEDAWAPMTLWVAMRPGDIYALCPLLPSKWQVPSVTIPTLTTSIMHKLNEIHEEAYELEDEERAVRQQYEWLSEIDNQDPFSLPTGLGYARGIEIRTRPVDPSPIPRLQGPFHFEIDDELEDLDLTDILVIPAKADIDALFEGEDEASEEGEGEGMSTTVICLASSTGQVHVCLELDGVEGQWLPRTNTNAFTTPVSNPPELLLLESLKTVRDKDQVAGSWPTFATDVQSRYNFFLTAPNRVTFFSLLSWAERLEAEFKSADMAGAGFRIKILCDSSVTERQEILAATQQDEVSKDKINHFPSCLVLYDYDVGYLALTFTPARVHAVILDSPACDLTGLSLQPALPAAILDGKPALLAAPQRSPYQPGVALYKSPMTRFVDEHVAHGHRHTLKEPVKLSPLTLDIMTTAHRILSGHTNALERAVSDLFRRCERLEGEMHDQLGQLVEISERVHDVSAASADRGEGTIKSRILAAQDRQKRLQDRYERIRTHVASAGGRPMSDRERNWAAEVDSMALSLGVTAVPVQEDDDAHRRERLGARFDDVSILALIFPFLSRILIAKQAVSLAKDLVPEAQDIARQSTTASESSSTPSPGAHAGVNGKIPQRLQRAKMTDANKMVERE